MPVRARHSMASLAPLASFVAPNSSILLRARGSHSSGRLAFGLPHLDPSHQDAAFQHNFAPILVSGILGSAPYTALGDFMYDSELEHRPRTTASRAASARTTASRPASTRITASRAASIRTAADPYWHLVGSLASRTCRDCLAEPRGSAFHTRFIFTFK